MLRKTAKFQPTKTSHSKRGFFLLDYIVSYKNNAESSDQWWFKDFDLQAFWGCCPQWVGTITSGEYWPSYMKHSYQNLRHIADFTGIFTKITKEYNCPGCTMAPNYKHHHTRTNGRINFGFKGYTRSLQRSVVTFMMQKNSAR